MDKKRSYKKGFITATLVIVIALMGIAGINMYVDPYVQYSKGREGIAYAFFEDEARYVNDGILRNYEYDAMITGTSMTQNFLVTEFEDLFGMNAVKTSPSGAAFKELNELENRAIGYNPELEVILRGIDLGSILADKDAERYSDLPEYLYDDIVINDVNYLLDKRTVRATLYDLYYTMRGREGTSMDDYLFWGSGAEGGFDYEMDPEKHAQEALTEEETEMVTENIRQNITNIADENPKVTFLYFITPYSIAAFDSYEKAGDLDKFLEAEHMLIEECLKRDNIQIHAFFDDADLICDLKNYKDPNHYLEAVNSDILKWLRKGDHRITVENFNDYCLNERMVIENNQ